MSDGSMTVSEAGRRGGEAVLARYGHAHFQRIGALAKRKPRAWYQAIGRKGGQAVRDRSSPDHYAAMGRKGGEKLLAQRGTDHFRQLGAMSHPRSPKEP